MPTVASILLKLWPVPRDVELRLGRLARQHARLELEDRRLGGLRAHRQHEGDVGPDRVVGGELGAELVGVAATRSLIRSPLGAASRRRPWSWRWSPGGSLV